VAGLAPTAADIVFLSLPSVKEVEVVCEQILGADRPPRTVVDLSTSDVRRTQALAERLATSGIELVDAPVARMRQAAKDGTLLILVGGTDEQFAALSPLLHTMGTDVMHCGPVGTGQVVKILNNMVVASNVRALAEAVAIGRTAGVEAGRLRELLAQGSADSFMLHSAAMTALVDDEFPFHSFPTVYMLKDLSLALTLASEGGIDASLASSTHSLLERVRDAGFAEHYYPAIIQTIDGGIEL
jgi:3-hydroxyisobutyrate dehydrogenase-like beta-hydroxyacid dehydrogenase